MSDYTKTFDGAAKDAGTATVLGADHDTEFDAIATAIGTKADKISGGTTGNLIELDGNGNIVDSGISSANLDGLSAVVETRLDGLDTSAASLTMPSAPTAHHRSGWFYMWDGSSAKSEFDVDTELAESTWETIGPTGSGATNIWADMDDIPSTARAMLVSILVGATEGASGITAGFHAAPGDVASPNADGGTAKFSTLINGNTSDSHYWQTTAIIPLDSSQIFKGRWFVTDESSILAFSMFYQGFIGDYS